MVLEKLKPFLILHQELQIGTMMKKRKQLPII